MRPPSCPSAPGDHGGGRQLARALGTPPGIYCERPRPARKAAPFTPGLRLLTATVTWRSLVHLRVRRRTPPEAVVEIRVLAAAELMLGPSPRAKTPWAGSWRPACSRSVHKQPHGPAGAVLAEGQVQRQPPARGAGKGTAPASPLLHQARGEKPPSSPLGKTTGQEAGDTVEKTRSLRSPEHQQDGLRDTGPLSSLQWADHPLIVEPRRERPDGHGAWTQQGPHPLPHGSPKHYSPNGDTAWLGT